MCVHVCVRTCTCIHRCPRNQRCSSASGVTGYCGLSDMGAANQTCPLQELHAPLTTEPSLQLWHKKPSLCPHASSQFPRRCRPGASSSLVQVWPCLHGDRVRAWRNSSVPACCTLLLMPNILSWLWPALLTNQLCLTAHTLLCSLFLLSSTRNSLLAGITVMKDTIKEISSRGVRGGYWVPCLL